MRAAPGMLNLSVKAGHLSSGDQVGSVAPHGMVSESAARVARNHLEVSSAAASREMHAGQAARSNSYRPPGPRFSYHLILCVAPPIMTMSSRPSPLMSTTWHPDADMPIGSRIS